MADQLQRIVPVLHRSVRCARVARVRTSLPDEPCRVSPRAAAPAHDVASQRAARRHGATPAALPGREARPGARWVL